MVGDNDEAQRDDKDPSLRGRFVKDVGLQSAATAITVAGGLVAAPVGVGAGILAAAGLPLVYEKAKEYLDERRGRLFQRAADELGDDGIAEALRAHPELLPLMMRALEMAATTEWEAHVDALGAALRDGIVGDLDDYDTSQLLTGIGTITPDGVAILEYLDTHEPHLDSQYQDVTIAKHFGWTHSRARTALRHLEEAGAVDTMGGGMDGQEGWKPLGMAAKMLGYLRDAGVTDDSPPADDGEA